MKPLVLSLLFLCISISLFSQEKDTLVTLGGREVTLTAVVIRKGTNVPGFIKRVEEDSTFYKAFKNLRILNYSSINDVRMFDKKGRVESSLYSKTKQWAANGCRVTNVLEEKVTGDYFDRNGTPKYYTGELYASLFFSNDTICGQTNVVGDIARNIKGKKGIDKRKEQLKMLFFNPGKDIPGIPLMGSKVQVFDEKRSDLYDFTVDIQEYKGRTAYVFILKIKDDLSFFKRDEVVIDEMTTWFDYTTFEVMERDYKMTYNAGVYKFNVNMHVEIDKLGGMLYPKLIRYDGSWGVLIKGSERGLFTATIYDLSLK